MKPLCYASCGLALLAFPLLTAAQTSSPVPEKVLKWLGEKVVILKSSEGTIFADCDDAPRYRSKEPPYAPFSGKSGVITKIRPRSTAPFELTIRMDDSNEELVLCNDRPLGFVSELAIAQSYVGKPVWIKGVRILRTTSGKGIVIPNTGRLVISRVEWGNYAKPIHVYFRSESGEEGQLESTNIRQGYGRGFDDRYHASLLWNGDLWAEQFHHEDPQKKHPKWSKAIWEIIERGEVAIGMSTEMAYMACGTWLRSEGAVVSSTGEGGRILSCDLSRTFFKKFLVEGGKVIRYVE